MIHLQVSPHPNPSSRLGGTGSCGEGLEPSTKDFNKSQEDFSQATVK